MPFHKRRPATDPAEKERDQTRPSSKTSRKKEMHALQTLGESLIQLRANQRACLMLPDRLAEALETAATLSHPEAQRRHRQFIGKLMRAVDPAPIQRYLAHLKRPSKTSNEPRT